MNTAMVLRDHQTKALSAIAQAVRGIINLPTGTGKSLIQARAIAQEIKKSPGQNGVYVILSPRILLSNQLLDDVRKDLMKAKVDAQYLVVHSGNGDYEADEQLRVDMGLVYRETDSTTKIAMIKEAHRKAHEEKVPLVVSCTYHSFERIVDSGIPLKAIHCDEAHYLVQERFQWIATLDNAPAFFYTATMRVTRSDDGIGMNNKERFGEVIAQALPIEMINAGEIVRPRLHIVDMADQPEGDEGDALAIVEAFREHRSLLNVGAKLLVVAKGQEHLQKLVSSKQIKQLLDTMPNLRLFDITSDYGARINGAVVKRQRWFKELKELTDSDQAIIMHVDILTEGIDMPGITGTMPLDSLAKSKFLQTLGRATRLHVGDRSRLYNKELKADDLKNFVKPYAYVVVPAYGSFGEDLQEEIREMITELRTYGFNPSEDIVIKQKRGKQVPVPIESVNKLDTNVKNFFDFITTVVHEIEEQEEVDALAAQRKNLIAKEGARGLAKFLCGLK